MKPLINYYLIISFLSLFFISSLNAQTSNLLTIGNMESAGWNIKNLESDAVLSYENNGSHDGTKAMKIVAKNIGQNSYYVIIGQGQQLNLKENEHYTISYWAKSPDAAGIEITPWIQLSDATINYPFTNLESGRLSNEWQKFSYTFNYSLVSSNKALFKFRVWSPGTIYLDNVQIGPADESDINNNTIDDEPIYSVSIVYKGEEINQTVYKSNCPIYKLGYMNMQSKDEIPLTLFKGRSISWTDFSFDDNVKVKVKVLNENKVPYVNENIRILPSRYNIDYKIDGNEISFNLTQAGQFSVEIGDDGYKNGLMIFANPTETNIPDENSPDYFVVEPSNNILNASNIPSGKKGIFFKKGGHNIDVFTIPSEIEYIYMADSAWVYGAFLKLEGKGVKIFGRGILSQEKMNYRVAHGIDIRVDNSGVEGITVADFKHFAIRLMGTNNEISWVKTIGGWVYNCDGITAYANSTVKNCFIWANDDAIKVYLNNIHWSDISVWLLNNGGVIQTSWGRTQALNCSIKRVDILRAEWVKAGFNAALLSCVGNRYQEPDRFSEQKDWLIEDVVTENPVPIIFGINPDSYSINHVRNFTLRNWNVKMSVGPVFQNRIKAGNPNTIIDGFVFDNFVFNDILLTQENWLEVLNLDTGRFKTPVVLSGVNKITNQEIRKFKVYPNPVKDILYIDNAQPNSAITVYYTNAVLALQTIGNRIDVSRLHAGYYLIKVDGNKSGIFCKKGD